MTQEQAAKPSKRIYLINRDFQLRYTGAAVLVGFITTILTAFVILFPLYIFEILRIPRFLPLPFLLGMVLAILINIVLVAFMGVVITHKIAGPIYSMTRQFRKVEQGEWASHIQLRKDDDLKYLARKFNEMIDAIKRQGEADYIQLRDARDKLDEKASPDAVREIDAVLSNYRKRFKLDT
jgi:HAMP domain-containing protein